MVWGFVALGFCGVGVVGAHTGGNVYAQPEPGDYLATGYPEATEAGKKMSPLGGK